jgi:hypothetical protein
LERELRAFAETSEGWRQKSMTLEQENDAIQKKLGKVTKELEKVKKEARARSATLLNQSASAQLSMALSIDVTTLIIGDWRVVSNGTRRSRRHVRSHEARGCRLELRAVRTDQGWLGLLQEAHERAGFPGLCREHHREQHSASCVA